MAYTPEEIVAAHTAYQRVEEIDKHIARLMEKRVRTADLGERVKELFVMQGVPIPNAELGEHFIGMVLICLMAGREKLIAPYVDMVIFPDPPMLVESEEADA